MQTPAERSLIDELRSFLSSLRGSGHIPRLMNIGAGKSLVIESYLQVAGLEFVCDRFDPEDPSVMASFVGKSYTGQVENMADVPDQSYEAAFANYVLEHVADIEAAAREIKRILKPGGLFVVSTPNPVAPEFILSRFTPLWFHQLIRGSKTEHRAFQTVYAYKNIHELCESFTKAGFRVASVKFFPGTETYLFRFPIIRYLSRFYDRLVHWSGIGFLHGNVCVSFINPPIN